MTQKVQWLTDQVNRTTDATLKKTLSDELLIATRHKELLEKNPEDFRLMKINEIKAIYVKLNSQMRQLIAEDSARIQDQMKTQTPEFFKQQIS